jgi:hypothetical protein
VPTNASYWFKVVRRGKDGFASILENTVTVSTGGLTNVVHGFDTFNPLVDKLEVYYGEYKVLLEKGINYNENINNLSIDLLGGWTTVVDDKFYFKLYKNLNQDNVNLVNNAVAIVQGLINKEEYSPATNYVLNNIIYYNGSSYMCIQPCTNVLPTNTTYWQLLVRHGNDGIASMTKTVVTIGSDNTTHIVHNLDFDSAHDQLVVINSTYGTELEEGEDYTLNVDNLSIDLIGGWSLNSGSKLKFRLFKGVIV